MNNRCRALLIVLIALAMPLLAHSPEHPVGTTVVGPAPHGRGPAAMATDGTDFFVVWSDQRAETRDSLVGTRVTRSGQVLDPLGIRLTMLNIGVQHVNVVWDGGAYLVTWTSGWADANVYAARVDRDGRIVMEPRVIAAEAMAMSGRYSASNGNVTVVAYLSLDPDAGSNRVVVLDRDGNTLHHETIIGTAQPYMSGLSVAATGSRFVVVWSAFLNDQIQTATVQAVALNAAGHLEKGPTPIGTGDGPMIATDGSRFLVVSQHWTEPKWQLLARTVDASLTEITPVQTLTNGYSIDAPSLLWRGNRYEIVAGRHENPGEGSHVFSIEVAADGKKLAERSLGPITTGYDSAFRSRPPMAAISWSRSRND